MEIFLQLVFINFCHRIKEDMRMCTLHAMLRMYASVNWVLLCSGIAFHLLWRQGITRPKAEYCQLDPLARNISKIGLKILKCFCKFRLQNISNLFPSQCVSTLCGIFRWSIGTRFTCRDILLRALVGNPGYLIRGTNVVLLASIETGSWN